MGPDLRIAGIPDVSLSLLSEYYYLSQYRDCRLIPRLLLAEETLISARSTMRTNRLRNPRIPARMRHSAVTFGRLHASSRGVPASLSPSLCLYSVACIYIYIYIYIYIIGLRKRAYVTRYIILTMSIMTCDETDARGGPRVTVTRMHRRIMQRATFVRVSSRAFHRGKNNRG